MTEDMKLKDIKMDDALSKCDKCGKGYCTYEEDYIKLCDLKNFIKAKIKKNEKRIEELNKEFQAMWKLLYNELVDSEKCEIRGKLNSNCSQRNELKVINKFLEGMM